LKVTFLFVTESNLSCDAPPPIRFQFVGGDLALDFTNTMGGKRGGVAREKLHSYADFLAWCSQGGLLDNQLEEELTIQAANCPEEAASVLARAIALREAIYRIFAAVIENRIASAEDIALLNLELASGLRRLCVAPGKGKTDFEWTWTRDGCALDQPLGPIARAAADLLISHAQLNQVHQCGGENCGWLFLDASKNHSRRWCDMRDCGNRAKVRRHRLKQGRKKS
jgi:predicted RNA-binding Zn ribbon-like protein